MLFVDINKLIKRNPGCRLVDVRTSDEYRMGHIPGAVNIPNESISNVQPSRLSDLSETILVYCQSGMRASQATKKLKRMGYSGVINAGGINSWHGEIERI